MSQMTSPSPTDERQQDSIPRYHVCNGGVHARAAVLPRYAASAKCFLRKREGTEEGRGPFLRSGPLLGAGRGGPDKVVHVVAVRLNGIVFNGHRHGMQLVASINLPLFNPLEPVGIIALRIIFAVMPGA